MLARTQPARSTTPERSTTPGSSAPERGRQARHDPGHRLGVGGLGGAQLGGGRASPGAARSRPIAIRSTSGQSTRPRRAAVLGAPADDRRRGAERRAEQEARLPDAVVAPRRAAVGAAGHRASTAHRVGHRELDLLDVRERRRRTAGWRAHGTCRGRRSSAGGAVAGRPVGPSLRRLEAVDRPAARPAPTPSPWPSRRSRRASPATAAIIGRSSG